MTFEEYQRSKGRTQSTQADFEEYQRMLKGQNSKGMQKLAATKKLKASAPSLKGSRLVDGSGQQVGVADAKGNMARSNSQARSVLDAYRNNPVAKQSMMESEDIDRSAKGLELAAKKDAVEFPGQQPPPAADPLSFTGNTKGVMAATAMGMQAAVAQNDMQAIIGGAGAGMQVASMLTGAAAGPVGMAVGAGTALMGMINSRKQRKAAEKAKREAEEKEKRRLKQARELQLLQSQSRERQNVFSNLMAAL